MKKMIFILIVAIQLQSSELSRCLKLVGDRTRLANILHQYKGERIGGLINELYRKDLFIVDSCKGVLPPFIIEKHLLGATVIKVIGAKK